VLPHLRCTPLFQQFNECPLVIPELFSLNKISMQSQSGQTSCYFVDFNQITSVSPSSKIPQVCGHSAVLHMRSDQCFI